MRFHVVCRPQIRIVDRDQLVSHADILRGSSRVHAPLRTFVSKLLLAVTGGWHVVVRSSPIGQRAFVVRRHVGHVTLAINFNL